jgi:hypothetical protein
MRDRWLRSCFHPAGENDLASSPGESFASAHPGGEPAVRDQRTGGCRDHFFKDPTDPTSYDLILNASGLSVPRLAEVIVETLHRM